MVGGFDEKRGTSLILGFFARANIGRKSGYFLFPAMMELERYEWLY